MNDFNSHQISEQPLFVPGVWGPCLSAMVPDVWLNEGGQSVTGRLVSAFRRRRGPRHAPVRPQAQMFIASRARLRNSAAMYSFSQTEKRLLEQVKRNFSTHNRMSAR